jgi:hypothetical protein
MRLLPSQRKARVTRALAEFESTGELHIAEPCDCGSQIRHNNGGNYHRYLLLRRDGAQYFIQQGTTSELDPPPEWGEITHKDVLEMIESYGDWL